MAVASVLLALLVGAAFTILLLTISDLRASERLVADSREASSTADQLEELVIDLETGVRGFVIARQERFLEPSRAAQAAIPGVAERLITISDEPRQRTLARGIRRDISAYLRDYSLPLMKAARENDPAVRSIAATAEGKRRVDTLRRSFERFKSNERAVLDSRRQSDDTNARRAVTAAAVGLAGSVALILVFGAYLARAIVRPLRRASLLAGQLAAGDLRTRMPDRFEVAACYAVSEVFTNAAKHSRASVVHVDAATRDAALYVSAHDDGIGGADLGRGSGLVGLKDRIEALGGTLSVRSPLGEGTSLEIALPLV
jgi:CHASE3 domain sensor protein